MVKNSNNQTIKIPKKVEVRFDITTACPTIFFGKLSFLYKYIVSIIIIGNNKKIQAGVIIENTTKPVLAWANSGIINKRLPKKKCSSFFTL